MSRRIHTLEKLKKEKYGRLTVIDELEPDYNCRLEPIRIVLCKCNCGNLTKVRLSNLLSKRIKSCGCLVKERRVASAEKTSKSLAKHNKWGTPLYRLWASMKQRCYNKRHISYQYYGKKGITVFKDWLSFEPFMKWALSHGYKEGLSIDRINSDGDYEPANCQFLTQGENTKRRYDKTITSFNS